MSFRVFVDSPGSNAGLVLVDDVRNHFDAGMNFLNF